MGSSAAAGRLVSLHFVARASLQSEKLVRLGGDEYETGQWAKLRLLAPRAVGAVLHLHERRCERSWIAGPIVDWRPSETVPGRVVFRFQANEGLRRCLAEGWGQEQARVWDRPGPMS